MFADLSKPGEICAVTAMKNGAPINGDNEAAEPAMQVREKARAPMITRRQRDIDRSQFHRLPVIEFMHNVKTEIVHKISHTDRHHDWLVGRDSAQCPPIEMIEVRMGDENKVYFRQMMNLKSGLFQPLDHFQPLRPNRIDQYINLVRLDQKRGVPNPGNANFARPNRGKLRQR